jgi:hypothetical protein
MELLAEEAPSDAAEFDAALDELARLARLVDGLLAVARAENTTASPEPVQVIDNLVDNALTAAPPGSQVLLAATGRVTGPGSPSPMTAPA